MMKRSKFFVPLITSTVIASTMPLSILTSCGAKYNKLTNEVYNESLDYFVGTDKVKGICSVPHASYNLDQIRDLIKKVATDTGCTVTQDYYGNIWWDVPATKGCENWKPLVLQAHMDMVWATSSKDVQDTHPEPVFDKDKGEDVIHTKDYETSLGADNGTGVAAILAVTTNKNLIHGKIRCIITADEEPGMIGAAVIGQMNEEGTEYVNVVDHKDGWDYLLNIDGENENDIYVSCAGGYSHAYTVNKFSTASLTGTSYWNLSVEGCRGGHSGLAISEGHCNAIKIAVDVMGYINNYLQNTKREHALLASIESNSQATNVVPSSAQITFASTLTEAEEDDINQYLKSVVYAYKQIYPVEQDLDIRVRYGTDKPLDKTLTTEDSDNVLHFIDYFIYGLVAQAKDGRPIASSNIAPVELDLTKDGTDGNEQFVAKIYSRSEDMSLLKSFQDIAETNYALLKGALESGETIVTDEPISYYEPYIYKENDSIRNLAKKGYKNVGIKPVETWIHGGVECSWWYKYNNNINQTGIGPTIDNVHDPKETLHLDSFKKYISIILDVIAGMKNI